ncbi:ADAMTS-like protein 5 isoform X3 [Salmo trutta]|uniref:ADAMTS like 5 n=1 Tax=Salmo trutta TaxID=8032 RepID=A0A674ERH6_SALTR|nr:ADAMTS-like protein 5 isoform X3 [Salmo trutta]
MDISTTNVPLYISKGALGRLSLCQALTFICLLVSAVCQSSQPSSSWVSAWGPSEGRSARARRQLHYRNEWASWNGWSVCSRSCGGGASVRTRTCITRNPVGGPCSGDPRQYKICNTKGCAGGSEDFREMQCSAYNDRPLVTGNSYRWTTFHGGSNPCELSCLAQGHNFYYNFGRVLDGTACSKEAGDVCVNGKCLTPGCDLILGSDQQEDACMVCGGQNSTCLHHRSVYQNAQGAAGPFGYNEVTMIPAGATHIRVTDNSRNYLALQNGRSQFVINGNWKISVPGEYSIAGTKLLYKRSVDTWESFEVAGPTMEDLHVMVLVTDRNPGIEYEYWLPPDRYALFHGRSQLRQPHHTASYIPWDHPTTTTTTTTTRPPPVTTRPYWDLTASGTAELLQVAGPSSPLATQLDNPLTSPTALLSFPAWRGTRPEGTDYPNHPEEGIVGNVGGPAVEGSAKGSTARKTLCSVPKS